MDFKIIWDRPIDHNRLFGLLKYLYIQVFKYIMSVRLGKTSIIK